MQRKVLHFFNQKIRTQVSITTLKFWIDSLINLFLNGELSPIKLMSKQMYFYPSSIHPCTSKTIVGRFIFFLQHDMNTDSSWFLTVLFHESIIKLALLEDPFFPVNKVQFHYSIITYFPHNSGLNSEYKYSIPLYIETVLIVILW